MIIFSADERLSEMGKKQSSIDWENTNRIEQSLGGSITAMRVKLSFAEGSCPIADEIQYSTGRHILDATPYSNK